MRRVDGYPPPAFRRQAIPGVSVLGQLAAIIAPVFACAAIGYLWARLRRPFETEFVTALVTNVGTPCLVASTLTKLSVDVDATRQRSEEHTSELQSLMRISYAVFCLKK